MRNIEYYTGSTIEEQATLNATQWQIDLLARNPEYTCWGCFEDYMSNEGSGWSSRQIHKTWADFGPWELDHYNEVVNFYFRLSREGHDCPACDGEGLNEATRKLGDDWYDFNETGRKWCHDLTEIEVEALLKAGRLTEFFYGYCDSESGVWYVWQDGEKMEVPAPTPPSAAEVNKRYKTGFGHDAINRCICVKARAKHLGIWGDCPNCEGERTIYDAPAAHVSLQLWVLHPRKGCSRGVYIENIEEHEVSAVLKFLQEAAQRNADRFKGIMNEPCNQDDLGAGCRGRSGSG